MTIILDADELERVTGYKTSKRQVKELPKQIDARPRRGHIQPMLAIIILVAAGIGFYAFIGTAPKEAVQLMLFLFWGLLGLLTVGGIIYELILAL